MPTNEETQDLISSYEELKELNNLNWKIYIFYAFLTAIFILVGNTIIQYNFNSSDDFAKRIMWNIEYKNPKVNFFDKEEDVEKIYENQRLYEGNQELKQFNENAKK